MTSILKSEKAGSTAFVGARKSQFPSYLQVVKSWETSYFELLTKTVEPAILEIEKDVDPCYFLDSKNCEFTTVRSKEKAGIHIYLSPNSQKQLVHRLSRSYEKNVSQLFANS